MMAYYMEEEENTNVIIDCDILEAAKENIQPLASGRRVTALASVLATPAACRDAKLEATRARMRERVKEAREAVERAKTVVAQRNGDETSPCRESDDEDDDEFTLEAAEELLLDAYVRLVTWTVEHYPKGQSASSGILELLEEATRVLRHSEHAKQDPRYLNLWVRYSSYVEKPGLIFEFLLANEIGTEWAKLYEEYANVLEKGGRRTKADEVYMLGINRKAEPFDHLERRHREFQKRMMVSAGVPNADVPTETPSQSQNSEIRPRRVLGDISAPATTTVPSPSTSHDDVFMAPSTSRPTLPSSSSQSRPNAKMPVFVDPDGTAAVPATRNAWPELTTKAERVKENVRTKEKMSGAVLKQKGAAKAATKSAAQKARAGTKIVPFRDVDDEKEKEGGMPSASSSASSVATMNGKKPALFKEPNPPTKAPIAKINPRREEAANNRSTANSYGTKSKSKIVPFKDPDSANTKLNPIPAKTKLQPFKDPEPLPASSTTSKPAFKPFVDEEGSSATVDVTPNPEFTAPKAPTFVPFRDEDAEQSALTTATTIGKVLGEKDVVLGAKAARMAEVEALRKDPFKNYAEGDF